MNNQSHTFFKGSVGFGLFAIIFILINIAGSSSNAVFLPLSLISFFGMIFLPLVYFGIGLVEYFNNTK